MSALRKLTPLPKAELTRDALELPHGLADWYLTLGEKTQEAYAIAWRLFGEWLGSDADDAAKRVATLWDVKKAHQMVELWREEMRQSGAAPASINLRLAGVRSFAAWLYRRGATGFEIKVRNLPVPRRKRRQAASLELVRAIKSGPRAEVAQDLRDYAAFRLMLDLGLRNVEVRGLDIHDFQNSSAGAATLRVKRAKSRVEHFDTLALPRPTEKALENWLDLRPKNEIRDNGPLFVTLGRNSFGQRMSGDALREGFERLCQQAGVAYQPPHSLRHFAAESAFEAAELLGVSTRHVLAFMRHSDLRTLKEYLDAKQSKADLLAQAVAEIAE